MRLKKLAAILLATMFAAVSLTGCTPDDGTVVQASSSAPADEVSATEESLSAGEEAEPEEEKPVATEFLTWDANQIALLGDILANVLDIQLDADAGYNDLRLNASFDDSLVEKVYFNASDVNFGEPGEYGIKAYIVFYREALISYMEDTGIDVSVFDGLSDSTAETIHAVVATTVTITAVDEEAETEDTEEAESADINNNASTDTASNTTSSGTSSSSGGSSSSSSSSSKSSSSSSSSSSTCSHNWVAITKTVTHAEEGHYEKVKVKDAYSIITCGTCGQTFSTYSDWKTHALEENHGGYSTKSYGATYENKWVVDKAAYTETVVTGYKCSKCGATK